MTKKKFRIVPNPKTDAALLEDMKKLLAKGIWTIEELASKLHVGRNRLHRLLDMFIGDCASIADAEIRKEVDTEVKKQCKKQCRCGSKAVCTDSDPATMICITRLPSAGMFPEFISYLTECIKNALDAVGL